MPKPSDDQFYFPFAAFESFEDSDDPFLKEIELNCSEQEEQHCAENSQQGNWIENLKNPFDTESTNLPSYDDYYEQDLTDVITGQHVLPMEHSEDLNVDLNFNECLQEFGSFESPFEPHQEIYLPPPTRLPQTNQFPASQLLNRTHPHFTACHMTLNTLNATIEDQEVVDFPVLDIEVQLSDLASDDVRLEKNLQIQQNMDLESSVEINDVAENHAPRQESSENPKLQQSGTKIDEELASNTVNPENPPQQELVDSQVQDLNNSVSDSGQVHLEALEDTGTMTDFPDGKVIEEKQMYPIINRSIRSIIRKHIIEQNLQVREFDTFQYGNQSLTLIDGLFYYEATEPPMRRLMKRRTTEAEEPKRVEKKKKVEKEEEPVNFELLCALACVNKEDRTCDDDEVYFFVSHHLPFLNNIGEELLKKHMRRAFRSKLFVKRPRMNKQFCSFKLKNEVRIQVLMSEKNRTFLLRHIREECLEEMIRGEAGFPVVMPQRMDQNLPEKNERICWVDKMSYGLLSFLACKNSPDNMIIAEEVVRFALHHFPYYRKLKSRSWRSSVQGSLSVKRHFTSFAVPGRTHRAYKINDGLTVNDFYSMSDPGFVRQNIDDEFFRKLVCGEVGLPRKYFYEKYKQYPQISGPENSAIFYHFLSIGMTLPPASSMFKSYTEMNPESEEPVFEENSRYKNSVSLMNEFQRKNGEKNIPITPEISDKFHSNISKYYALQREYKEKGLSNWEIPPNDVVMKVVLDF